MFLFFTLKLFEITLIGNSMVSALSGLNIFGLLWNKVCTLNQHLKQRLRTGVVSRVARALPCEIGPEFDPHYRICFNFTVNPERLGFCLPTVDFSVELWVYQHHAIQIAVNSCDFCWTVKAMTCDRWQQWSVQKDDRIRVQSAEFVSSFYLLTLPK